MSSASAALPDDVEALKRLVLGRDETIAKLLAEIARLKRWRFGRSAERMDQALLQLQLALDDLQRLPEVEPHNQGALSPEESTHTPPSQRPLRLRRVPRALPAHLPRETIVHAPASCTCPDCGAAMRKLGEDCRVASCNFATGCLTKDVTRHLTEEALNGLLPPYPHSLLQRIELSQAVPPRVTRLELDQ